VAFFKSRSFSRRQLPYRDLRLGDLVRPDDGIVTAEVPAFRAVRPFGEGDLVGVPFGRGFGLEEATALVRPIFGREEPERTWFYSRAALRGLGEDIYAKRTSMDDWDDALGHHQHIFDMFGLSRGQLAQAIDDLGEIKKLLVPLDQEQGPLYDRWRSNIDWALDTWVWATVLNRRLGYSGKTVLFDL
jgi:hypothetical protein